MSAGLDAPDGAKFRHGEAELLRPTGSKCTFLTMQIPIPVIIGLGENRMARSTTHASQKSPEEPVEALILTILEDILQTGSMPSDQWRGLWPNPFTSMAIPAGGGREYPCTQAGVDAAHRLTEQTWQARADLRQTISRETFNRISFTAIGQAIASAPSHVPPDAGQGPADDALFAAVAADYATNLDALVTNARPTVDRHIPCELFHLDQNVAAFSVGPVKFSPRAEWIADHVKDPLVLSHVRQVDQRLVPFADLRERAFVSGAAADLSEAVSILTFLDGHSWFGTVRMENHERSNPTTRHRSSSGSPSISSACAFMPPTPDGSPRSGGAISLEKSGRPPTSTGASCKA